MTALVKMADWEGLNELWVTPMLQFPVRRAIEPFFQCVWTLASEQKSPLGPEGRMLLKCLLIEDFQTPLLADSAIVRNIVKVAIFSQDKEICHSSIGFLARHGLLAEPQIFPNIQEVNDICFLIIYFDVYHWIIISQNCVPCLKRSAPTITQQSSLQLLQHFNPPTSLKASII
jgi:hypothetical protein